MVVLLSLWRDHLRAPRGNARKRQGHIEDANREQGCSRAWGQPAASAKTSPETWKSCWKLAKLCRSHQPLFNHVLFTANNATTTEPATLHQPQYLIAKSGHLSVTKSVSLLLPRTA